MSDYMANQSYYMSSNYLSPPPQSSTVPERNLSPIRNMDDSFYSSSSPGDVQEVVHKSYSMSSNYLSPPPQSLPYQSPTVPGMDLSPIRNMDDSFYSSSSPGDVQEVVHHQNRTLTRQNAIYDFSTSSPGDVQEVVHHQNRTLIRQNDICDFSASSPGDIHEADSIFETIPDLFDYLTEDEGRNAIENLRSFRNVLKSFDSDDLESYWSDDFIDVLSIDNDCKESNHDQANIFSTVHQVPNQMDINMMAKYDVTEPMQFYEYEYDIHNNPKVSTVSTIEFPIHPTIRRKRKNTPLHAQKPPVDEAGQKRWQRAVKAHKHRECKEAQLKNMTEYAMKAQNELDSTKSELRQYKNLLRKSQVDMKNITKDRDNYKHRCEKMEDILKGCRSTII
ncbi:unnamed protein product [Meganyctiphanes norvegica]|uniref:BZIP domain-containing protein n=1 Tax=Meganyctiphanes norvegica TaxID=48144 RepID=A0AAV2S941_MEGNR